MRFLAHSGFEYVRRQIERYAADAGSGGKLLFMMPSLPPKVVLEIGSFLTSFCVERPSLCSPLIKVSAPLAGDWESDVDLANREASQEISEKGWLDDGGSLTRYRNLMQDSNALLVVLLIGVDRVTDSSSMADFHHCDLRTIWEDELGSSFSKWTRALLEPSVGFEDDTVLRFDWVLKPLVERGLADLLQVSALLQDLDLSGVQDGRDAETVLLNGLGRFGLPGFGNLRFTTPRAFGAYLDDALAFFSYDAFLEDRNRQKALKAIAAFENRDPKGEAFDPNDRQLFASDQELLNGLKRYIGTADGDSRKRLLGCDFVIVRDKILSFRAQKDPDTHKEKRETIRKLSGGPVEVVLSALWTTLGEFKRAANERGVFAHEVLKSIGIESRLFKHDADGETSEERRSNAISYLSRLLGGVDQLLEQHFRESRFGEEGRQIRSHLLRADLDCQSARTAEPYLQFAVTVLGDGFNEPVTKQFAWRLPETQPYRVAVELVQWAADALSRADGFCLPVFHVPYYEELMLAKDDDEIHRVILHCIQDEGDSVCNLLGARGLDSHVRCSGFCGQRNCLSLT